MLHNLKGFIVGMIIAIIALISFMYFVNKPVNQVEEPKTTMEPEVVTETIEPELQEESETTAWTETLLEGPAETSFENNVYTNASYSFRLTIPEDWELEKEQENIGGDNTRATFTTPSFEEKLAGTISNDILYISVSSRHPDNEYEYLGWNLGNTNESVISIAGQESRLITGTNEFGQMLTVVQMPHGANTIVLMLRTDQEPFASQFQEVLDSFEYLS